MDKKNVTELNEALNGWPEGTRGFNKEWDAIQTLNTLGSQIGYGRLTQLAESLCKIQCDGADIEPFKKSRQKRLELLKG